MIQAFVGLVGGGKSFCSTRRMMSYMASGGRVASNIRLTGYDDKSGDLLPSSPVVEFLRSIGWEYQPKQYTYISYDTMVEDPEWYKLIPAGFSRDRRTLCVVDEATDLFDTLDGGKLRSDSGYRGLFHFLRLSRHAHIDVLFICQDLNTINSRLKNLVSNIWRSTDMRNFSIGVFKFGFPFDVFLLQLFDRTGKNQIQREFVKKDPKVFGLYESETFGGCLGVKWDGVAVADGKIRNQKGKKKMSKFAWVLLVCSCLASVTSVFYRPKEEIRSSPEVDKISQEIKALKRAVNEIAAKTNSVQVVAPPVAADPPKPKKPDYIRGIYHYHKFDHPWIEFDGARFLPDMPSEYGRVLNITPSYTICMDDDENVTYLLPLDEEELERIGSLSRIASALRAPHIPPGSLQGAVYGAR